MTVEYRLGGVLLTNRVELTGGADGFSSAAERGVVASSGVRFDDPNGDLTVTPWATFTVDDTAATPTRVWTGYIGEMNVSRGDKEFIGAGRVYDCTLIDLNTLLHMRVLRSNAANRPAETDVARVAWLLTSEALAGIVTDEGLVSSSNAGSFLAADTRRTYADDVLTEVASSSVKNFFVYYDTTSGNPALFYDRDIAAVYDATIAISNVAADYDGTATFAPSSDSNLYRAGDEIYTGVSYGWRGDPIYVHSTAIAATYGIERDAVYDTNRIGVLATAQQAAIDWLNVRSGPKDVITTTLRLTSAAVNKAYAGQRIHIRYSHFPGYESAVYARIRRRDARPAGPGFWDVTYQLWTGPVVDPESDVGVVDNTFCTALDDLGATISNTSSGTYGPLNSLTSDSSGRILYLTTGSSTPTRPHPSFAGNWTSPTLGTGGTPDFAADSSNNSVRMFVLGPGTMVVHTSINTDPTITLSWNLYHSDGTVEDANGGGAVGDDFTITVPDDGACLHMVTLQESYAAGGDKWGFGGFDWTAATVTPAPSSGTWLTESLGFGDGATTDFTTTYSFVPGSLTVRVDHVDQTSALTATDGGARSFSLAFAPASSEQVDVTYKVP